METAITLPLLGKLGATEPPLANGDSPTIIQKLRFLGQSHSVVIIDFISVSGVPKGALPD